MMNNHNGNNGNATATAAAANIRAAIPLLRAGGMHYLDNAATALMPEVVINATANYDAKNRANIGRGLHKFAEVADAHYADARRTIAGLINAAEEEVIFTSGTSAGLNFLAAAIGQTLSPDDAVVLSIAEHHSNIVPWQIAARRFGFSLRFAAIDECGAIDIDDIRRHNADGKARVFSLTHASNVSGAINNIGELSKAIKENNNSALLIIDGAQYMPHSFADMQIANSGADFYAFSGHKCYAPNGIGVLWGRKSKLEALPIITGGGGTVASVYQESYEAASLPRRLEAGTPPITQATGMAAAMQWMHNLPKAAQQNETNLTTNARRQLRDIKNVNILFDRDDNNNKKHAPIISFTMKNIHPHDCCQILSANNIAARGGNMCAEPLMRHLSINGCIRISIAPYNNGEDIAAMINGVKEVNKILGE